MHRHYLVSLVVLAVLLSCWSLASASVTLSPTDSIQAAIDAAASGETIILSPGNYEQSVDMKGKNLTLTGQNPEDDDVVASTTLLRVIFSAGDTAAKLAGVTVVETLSGSPASPLLGGCVFVPAGTAPYLYKCVFRYPTTTLLGTRSVSNINGGGVYAAGNARVEGCTFINCRATDGGAMYLTNCQATVRDCEFRDCQASLSCGAIAADVWTGRMDNCVFVGGRASQTGAGAIGLRNCSGILQDCAFVNCQAPSGGAMVVSGGQTSIIGCAFNGNVATSGSGGGAYLSANSAVMRDCLFSSNLAKLGGGLRLEGGRLIERCEFVKNKANTGGGILMAGSVTVRNCILNGNEASIAGGGLVVDPAAEAVAMLQNNTIVNNIGVGVLIRCVATIANSIISKNSGGGVEMRPYVLPQGKSASLSATVRYCDVVANETGNYVNLPDPTGQLGNISVLPRFANPYTDFHLRSRAGRWSPASESWVMDFQHSPCIDAGNPAAAYAAEPLPNGGRVDMGAYGNTEEASKSLNRPPTAPTTVAITPDQPVTTQDLVASVSGGVDPDHDDVWYEIQWQGIAPIAISAKARKWFTVDGVLPASRTEKGQVWVIRARTRDKSGNQSDWVTSSPVRIQDSAPTAPKAVVIQPNRPLTDDAPRAVATGAFDADGDAIELQYRWYVSENQADWTEVQLASQTNRLPPELTRDGQYYKVMARASAGGLTSNWISSRVVQIGDTPPTAPTSVKVKPASPDTRDDLLVLANGATDTDTPSADLTYEFRWKLTNPPPNADGGLLPGQVLPASVTVEGQTWVAEARACDGNRVGPWAASAPVTIGNAPPSAPRLVAITPAKPGDGDDLIARARGATDPDPADALQYRYQWRSSADGVTWGDWTRGAAKLPAADTVSGFAYQARARAFDGTESGPWTESPPVTVWALLSEHVPALNASGVSRTAAISLTFRRAVDQASIESHFDLSVVAAAAQRSTISGTFEWVMPNLKVLFRPDVPLASSTRYQVALSAGIARLAAPPTTWAESFEFTTSSEPVVVSGSPIGNTVAIGSPIEITFDQGMNHESVQDNFSIMPLTAGTFTWIGDTVLRFQPSASLRPTRWYTVGIGKGAVGLNGRALSAEYRWSFQTESAVLVSVSATASAAKGGGISAINVSLSSAADVEVCIQNIAGRTVAVLPERHLSAGLSTLLWNGRGSGGTALPAGRYLARVTARTGGACGNALVPLQR